MLSDDISGMVTAGVGTVATVASNAARGAVMFGLLALAAVSIAVAAPALFGAASIGAGIWAFLGALPAAAVGAGWAAAGVGAMTGATLMGVTSVIPGTKEHFGRRPVPAPNLGAPVHSPTHADLSALRSHERASTVAGMDNHLYREGHGAAMAQRGSNMQANSINK